MDGMTIVVGRRATTADQGGGCPAGISDRARLEAERRTVGMRPERHATMDVMPTWLDATARPLAGVGAVP
jgi:hypothetical protein